MVARLQILDMMVDGTDIRFTYCIRLDNGQALLGQYTTSNPRNLTAIKNDIRNLAIDSVSDLYDITLVANDFIEF
jgi:hypothetical protein